MNEYIFYTTEEYAKIPNNKCLFIGRSFGKNRAEAQENLLKDNKWIAEAGYRPSEFIAKQILTEKQIADIKAVVEYLWADEKKHYEEWLGIDIENESYIKGEDTDYNHIFSNLRRLKMFYWSNEL
ncbi:MAG: hypothetical protein IKV37_00280 [Prevotella sp.]|nr:hypothetical protein [Prevotella sp.]